MPENMLSVGRLRQPNQPSGRILQATGNGAATYPGPCLWLGLTEECGIQGPLQTPCRKLRMPPCSGRMGGYVQSWKAQSLFLVSLSLLLPAGQAAAPAPLEQDEEAQEEGTCHPPAQTA